MDLQEDEARCHLAPPSVPGPEEEEEEDSDVVTIRSAGKSIGLRKNPGVQFIFSRVCFPPRLQGFF